MAKDCTVISPGKLLTEIIRVGRYLAVSKYCLLVCIEKVKSFFFSPVTLCWCDPTRLTLAVRPLMTMWEVEPQFACDEMLMSQSHIYLQTSKAILLSHAQYFSQVLLKQHVWLSSSGRQETNRNVQRWQHVTNVCERPDLGNDLPAYSWIQRMLIGGKMHKWKCVIC